MGDVDLVAIQTQEKVEENGKLVVDGDFDKRRRCVGGGWRSLSGRRLGLKIGVGKDEEQQMVKWNGIRIRI